MDTKLKNQKGLVPFLSSHRCKYEVVQDGWYVQLTTNSREELFNIGKMFGDYLAANPQYLLVTIEELEQRGDIPKA